MKQKENISIIIYDGGDEDSPSDKQIIYDGGGEDGESD